MLNFCIGSELLARLKETCNILIILFPFRAAKSEIAVHRSCAIDSNILISPHLVDRPVKKQ